MFPVFLRHVSTASVTEEIRLGDTSVPYISCKCAWISRGHAAGIQREGLVVEARPAGLVLLDDLRVKGAMPVTRTSMGRSPNSPLSFFLLKPLHVLPVRSLTG
ncbi:hypothetical protein N878_00405 [Pseudomonas sp. EGD-AK9]|nr:hypothetical protein N878_00405 [Pseudomonas sp. EGD-AK9]